MRKNEKKDSFAKYSPSHPLQYMYSIHIAHIKSLVPLLLLHSIWSSVSFPHVCVCCVFGGAYTEQREHFRFVDADIVVLSVLRL